MADEQQKPKASKKSKAPEAGKAPEGGKTPETTDDASTKKAKAKPAPVAEPVRENKKSIKVPKLQKKNNPHLPRKVKKAQKKAAAAQARVTSTPTQS